MIHPADGRVLFTLPAGDQTIVGTTETPTNSSDRDSRASTGDVSYLLAAANAYFPNAALTGNDVVAAWSGVRPLARQLTTSDVGSASREHTIDKGPRGVIHVTGGKLTTYREMASQVVDLIAGPEAKASLTAVLPLPGGDRSVEEVTQEADGAIADAAVRDRLVAAYGSRWRDVWSIAEAQPQFGERVSGSHPVIGAEFVHAVEREMAMTLGDLLIRRTHLAFETADQARSLAPLAAHLVGPRLGWTAADHDAALRAYDEEIARTFRIVGVGEH